MLFEVLIIFMVTLGPLKVMLPIMLMTEDIHEERIKRKIAFKAIFISILVVFFIAIVGPYIMDRWKVSTQAIAIVVAILLFTQSFSSLNMSKNSSSLFDISIEENKMTNLDRIAFALAIPYVVTPAGVAGILSIKLFNPEHYFEMLFFVLSILFGIMLLNFIAMVYAEKIVKAVTTPILVLIGWIFSIFQMILAVQIFLMVFRKLI